MYLTYFDSDTIDDYHNLKIVGCNLTRADYPSNTKRGGVCIYYTHSLAVRLLNIHYLMECMNFEIFGGKICNFMSLYCSPCQSSDTFEDFADNFQHNLDKITKKSAHLLTVISMLNHQVGINTTKQLMKVLKLMQ